MNKEKIKYILEVTYNCPFILLILCTSLFFFPLFHRIEGRENDKNITVLKNIEENKEAVDSSIVLQPAKKKEENAGKRKEENVENKTENTQNKEQIKTETPINTKKEEKRATEFLEYEPIETNSRYYTDAGKVALTTSYDYVLENDSYFNDAVFLGDSRTLGLADYSGFEEADFYCDNGMTIYKLLDDKGVTWQRTGEKVDMKKVLQEKHYGKIYIMLGMNELGYGDTTMYLKQYLKVLRQIREWQPDAVVYVMANLHVSREKNNMETEFNNVNINAKNVAAARLADGRDVFYLDCNPLFTDEEGYLQADLTFDGVHLYAQHYDKWRTFLMEHGVEREAAEGTEEVDGKSGDTDAGIAESGTDAGEE